jgi:hypothetical protein
MDWSLILDGYGEAPDEPVDVSVRDFGTEPMSGLPEGVKLQLFESEWPEMYISREGPHALFHLTEHIYIQNIGGINSTQGFSATP